MSARINQHRPVVHHRVAIVANAVFGGHLIIGHAAGRQRGSDPDLLLIAVRGSTLPNRVLSKARALLVRKAPDDRPAHAAHNGPNGSSDDSTANSACGRPSSGAGLSLSRHGEREEAKGGYSRNVANCH